MTFDRLLRGLFSQTGKGCLEGQSASPLPMGLTLLILRVLKSSHLLEFWSQNVVLQQKGLLDRQMFTSSRFLGPTTFLGTNPSSSKSGPRLLSDGGVYLSCSGLLV